MDEHELRGLIRSVKAGTLPRREFMRTLAAFGLSAPVAAQLLAWSGSANAQQPFVYKPTKRGGGGALRLLYWQAPTLPNVHFGVGSKDQEAARVFYEPLAAWDGSGNLVPILAAEIPTLENGGVARDGKSVTWKLKRGVQWHDGKPFTADDCVFTAQYSADPETSTFTIGSYRDIEVVKLDPHTIRIDFGKPTPAWADPFVNLIGQILPKHLFEPYKGAKIARSALLTCGRRHRAVQVRRLQAGRHAARPDQHELSPAEPPHFDTIELKGGGDAVSAARAVMQTGEFDFAWNLLVEDEVLQRLESGGKGRAVLNVGG
jgi:peptide/nickel transport system substrate-binding protein